MTGLLQNAACTGREPASLLSNYIGFTDDSVKWKLEEIREFEERERKRERERPGVIGSLFRLRVGILGRLPYAVTVATGCFRSTPIRFYIDSCTTTTRLVEPREIPKLRTFSCVPDVRLIANITNFAASLSCIIHDMSESLQL